MKIFRLITTVIILLASVVLCQQIIVNSRANQENKQDYAEINHIKYGLFSINSWKEQLTIIITDEIKKLDLTPANQAELKKHVEIQLDGLIDNVNKRIRDVNMRTSKGRMKQFFINSFVDIGEIKKGIPEYADAIMAQMTKAKTENKIKGIVIKKIDQYMDKTFEMQDESAISRIIRRMGASNIDEARNSLNERIIAVEKNILLYSWILMGLGISLFLMAGLTKGTLPASQFISLIVMLLILLLSGVTTPMIDMEAKISELSFMLMDHPIGFVNQVLYFQTKSILDVFWIMITHRDVQMKIVGILMVAFSIVFPLLKMLGSIVYYYDFKKLRNNSWIQFFVLKSGKWSMTDVMVVAIFMAYIGFNGIITSQFGKLNSEDQDMVLLTTNGTSLQPGFYLFFIYSMLALFLSSYLTKKTAHPQ